MQTVSRRCFADLVIAAALLLTGSAGAHAAPDPLSKEVANAVDRLTSESRTERAYGAIGVVHLARKQRGLQLLPTTDLLPWQRALAPVVAPLIQLLLDDAPLQWVDDQDRPTGSPVTTTRREAALALAALERAAVEPLIAVADDPALGPRVDKVLREICGDGPPRSTRADWLAWWATHRQRPLSRERGQGGVVVTLALVSVGLIAFLFWWQRRRSRADEQRGPRLTSRPG